MKKAIGVDEVGRGCLAGPVIACALEIRNHSALLALPLNDSKKLTPKKRAELLSPILEQVQWFRIGIAFSHEVDLWNIHHASLLAMLRSVISAPVENPKEYTLFIDGIFPIPSLSGFEQKTVVKGDSLIPEIMAASIVAKVYRDTLLEYLSEFSPSFQWNKNKGYGTVAHKKALSQHFPTTFHRQTFLKTDLFSSKKSLNLDRYLY